MIWNSVCMAGLAVQHLNHISVEFCAVLPANSLVNYSSFIVACVILVDFLLDGHPVPQIGKQTQRSLPRPSKTNNPRVKHVLRWRFIDPIGGKLSQLVAVDMIQTITWFRFTLGSIVFHSFSFIDVR